MGLIGLGFLPGGVVGFEMLISDNFGDLPFISNLDDKNNFHEILMQKNNFSKAERKIGAEQGVTGEIKFKYNRDPYEYPKTIKELMRVFQDPDKFNKNIFLTKIGVTFPPVKKKGKRQRISKPPRRTN